MASIIKLGTILLDGVYRNPGSKYFSGEKISFGNQNDISWVVVNGLVIAALPLLINISWDELHHQDLVFGKQVSINGQKFLCRLLRVGAKEGAPNEWDAALDIAGENNDLWHWKNAFCWGQEITDQDESYCATRGYSSARYYDWYPSFNRSAHIGFRPVLEPLPSEELISGCEICAIGGQSVLYGKLLELTEYDALIHPEPGSITADADHGQIWRRLSDGPLLVERSQVILQRMGSNSHF